MKMQEINNEEMFCLVAPDGTAQLSTICPDYAGCVGWVNFLSLVGMSKGLDEMINEGFQILPVKLSIIQNGTEKDAFEKGKAAIQNSNKG